MKKASIIMVNYNGSKFMGKKDLKEIIESFLRTDYGNFEFIFVDNHSDDDSIGIAEKIFKKHKHVPTQIIKTGENIGFAGGCEEGMKRASGDYIVLVNNDNKPVKNNWLKNLLKVLDSDKKIGAVFSKTLKWDNPKIIGSVGISINPMGFVKIIGENENDIGQYEKIKDALVWQTPVAFRKELIPKIGGFFDLDFAPVSLHDDTDSSIRIWMVGYRIVCVPSSLVLHKRSATMKKLPKDFVAFHSRKNILQTMLKDYELKNVLRYTSLTIMIYIASIPYFLLKRRFDKVKTIVKSLAWNLFYFPKILIKRRKVQKLRKVGDDKIFNLFEKISLSDIIGRRNKEWP